MGIRAQEKSTKISGSIEARKFLWTPELIMTLADLRWRHYLRQKWWSFQQDNFSSFVRPGCCKRELWWRQKTRL